MRNDQSALARHREAHGQCISVALSANGRQGTPLSPAAVRHRSLTVEQFETRELLASVTLTPIADNTIFEDQTTHSDGVGPTLFSGETLRRLGARRVLLKFDVANSVPAGAHIDSVTLQLHVFKDRGGSNQFGAYRLRADWGEGGSNSGTNGGDGANALKDDVTWSVRFTRTQARPAVGDVRWRFQFPSQRHHAGRNGRWAGKHHFQVDQPATGHRRADWLDSPSTQFGWMIKEVDETVLGSAEEFDSRQSATPANRPSLTINYTPLPSNLPPTLDAISDPPAILEDSDPQSISLLGISAGAGETQNLTISVTSTTRP